jgi:16S rRNA processing protein RimM
MVPIGKIVRTQGNKGDLRLFPYLDYSEHIKELDSVYIMNRRFDVLGIRPHNQFLVMKLEGCDSIDSGRKLVGCLVEVPKEKIKELPNNQFYWHDLKGLSVFDEKNNFYGKIDDIFPTGSNDIFVVRNNNKEILIPAIKDVVTKIDIKQKRVIIHLMEGLIE